MLKTLSGLRPALIGSFVALIILSGAVAQAQPNLFRGRGQPVNPGPHGAVANAVDVDADVLSAGPAQLWLDLPGRPAALASATDFETRANDGLVWRGNVPSFANSQVVLTRHKGLVVGTVWVDDETYEISPGPDQSHTITRLDPSSFPACEAELAPRSSPASAQDTQGSTAKGPLAIAAAADPNAEMHLLSMYTPQARDAAGSVAAIEATIQAAVDNANSSFISSDMIGRYVLVHTALAGHNDTGSLSSDLSWLIGDAATANLRNLYRADMVSLIVENGGTGCGIGYVQRNPGPAFASSAFQVTDRGCAVGNLTFAHEHGHNIGLEHDPANGPAATTASYPWSFGHHINSNLARTVMAYNCPLGCPRLMFHSNPDIFYQGYPTGVANAADNARTGDTTALIVHDFRPDANPATLNSIAVTPSSATVEIGQQQAYTAIGTYSDASTQDLTATATWSSTNAAVATVSAGTATGVSAGSAGITASLDGVTINSATLTVTSPATLSSIAITPAASSIDVGQQQVYDAIGTYSDSSTQNLTATATWSSANAAVATVSAGTATAVSTGSAGITAALDGVTSNSATLTVNAPAVLTSITVGPSSATISSGSTQQFSATGNYDDFTTQDLTASATWASSNAAVATINASGLASGSAAGTTNITASFDGVNSLPSSLTVTVFDATGLAPSLIQAGGATTVTIFGTGFVSGATLGFQNGSGPSPQATTLSVSASQIVTSITVGTNGPKRNRTWDVVVQNGDGQTDVLPAALTVTLNAIPNNPPSVSIASPGDGSSYALAALISFSGSANDVEDGDISANLSWTSNLDGAIGSGAGFSTAALSEGVHQITASVTDAGGLGGNSSISITVGNPNTAPNVTITSPGNGSSFIQGASISFVGTATDTEDGNVAASLSWSSNLDGGIGAGASFSTSGLSIGNHTITASVTDAGGLLGTDQITVTVTSNSPSVTVTSVSPASMAKGTSGTVMVNGSNFVSGAGVSFENGGGPVPTATSVVFVNSSQLSVTVSVPSKGPKRAVVWDVRVTNPDSTSGVGAGMFTTTP